MCQVWWQSCLLVLSRWSPSLAGHVGSTRNWPLLTGPGTARHRTVSIALSLSVAQCTGPSVTLHTWNTRLVTLWSVITTLETGDFNASPHPPSHPPYTQSSSHPLISLYNNCIYVCRGWEPGRDFSLELTNFQHSTALHARDSMRAWKAPEICTWKG